MVKQASTKGEVEKVLITARIVQMLKDINWQNMCKMSINDPVLYTYLVNNDRMIVWYTGFCIKKKIIESDNIDILRKFLTHLNKKYMEFIPLIADKSMDERTQFGKIFEKSLKGWRKPKIG